MRIDSFKDLLVWQKAMDFVVSVYVITSQLPHYEQFGLASQLRRSAVSIPSNISEGSRRHSKKDFSHFCSFAHGSAAEAETQLLLLERLYPKISITSELGHIIEIQKMLTILIRNLK